MTAIGALVLLAGCGGGKSTAATPIDAPIVLAPACSSPAPLNGSYSPGYRTYILFLTPDSSAEQARLLSVKYGFTFQYIYYSAPAFVVEASPEALASLRCDPLVVSIAYNTSPSPY